MTEKRKAGVYKSALCCQQARYDGPPVDAAQLLLQLLKFKFNQHGRCSGESNGEAVLKSLASTSDHAQTTPNSEIAFL